MSLNKKIQTTISGLDSLGRDYWTIKMMIKGNQR